MKYNLVVDFYNRRRMTEEPQGDYWEFNSFPEFLEHTEEAIGEVEKEFPESREVLQKLWAGDYTVRETQPNYLDICVKVASVA